MTSVKAVTQDGIRDTIRLYARCMSENRWFQDKFNLHEAKDRETLQTAITDAYGPTLAFAMSLGTSLAAYKDGHVIGLNVAVWYDSVRRHIPELFDILFREEDGTLPHIEDMHAKIHALGPGTLYGAAICVDPAFRRQKIGSGLIRQTISRHRPNWYATDVSNMDSLPLYRIYPETHEYPIGKDYVLVTIKCP